MFLRTLLSLSTICSALFAPIAAAELPKKMQEIMQQSKYAHSTWGLYIKDMETGKVLFDLNSEQMFLPASTTKLFSMAALLNAYGGNYRFKTPVYAVGKVQDGVLHGDLILVAQGDLTMGGRQDGADQIAFTKMDHIIANNVPGVILTKQDPLYAFNKLAEQIRAGGIQRVDGTVRIDDRLFDVSEQRGMMVSPIMVNENLIDLVLNPAEIGQTATLKWRPIVPGYSVSNEVKTVAKTGVLDIQISADDSGQNIVLKGTIPLGEKDIVRTASIKDPSNFARAALIQALKAQGIVVNSIEEKPKALPEQKLLNGLKPVAVWTSPPLSEYVKLVLKVSHNLGANLAPLLLAVKNGERTFEAGLREIGKFTVDVVKISPESFVFIDGAGGDDNRLTPQAEVQLLGYMHKLPREQFQKFFNALPILGVDGSLEDFAKNTDAVGKVRAKTGTGMTFNPATNQFFLTTQTLAGYIEGRNGHMLAYMLGVNNAALPGIEDVFPVFEDVSQISAALYAESE